MAKNAKNKTVKSKSPKSPHWEKNPHFKKGFEKGHQPVQVAALMGNDFWKRAQHNSQRVFKTPEQMFEVFQEYIKHAEENHTNKIEVYKGSLVSVPQMALYTLRGFTLYAGVSSAYFNVFFSNIGEDDPRREDWLKLKAIIEDTIYQNKYSGATLGHFNANLVGYDLGVRQDVPAQATSNGLVIQTTDSDSKSLLKSVKERLNKADQKKKEK